MNFPPPSPRQARIFWAALTGLAIALLVALVVAMVWGLGHVLRVLAPVLWPLAIAGVVAYLLDPVVDFLEHRKVPRSRGIVLVFLIALLFVAALFTSVVPQMVNETRDLMDTLPRNIAKTQHRIENFINHPPAIVVRLFGVKTNATLVTVTNTNPETTQDPGVGATNSPSGLLSTTNPPGSTNAVAAGQGSSTTTNSTASILSNAIDRETLQSATGFITRYVPKVGSWLFGQVGRVASWFGVLAGLSLIPVYAFYLLLEKRGISSHWANYLPVSDSRFKDEMVFVIKSINDYLIAFFRGQVLVAICDGILYTIGFLIIGLPYAVLVGVMATFLTMIPFIGAILTCVAALIIMLVQHGDWQHPAMVMAVFAVVQALEGLVISPKIMGNKVQLHPVTIIISVMVGTTLLGGLLGGILAIPLTAALRVVMFRYVWKRPTAEAIEEARAAR